MASDQIKDYLEEYGDRYSPEQLKAALLGAGYRPEDITQTMSSFASVRSAGPGTGGFFDFTDHFVYRRRWQKSLDFFVGFFLVPLLFAIFFNLFDDLVGISESEALPVAALLAIALPVILVRRRRYIFIGSMALGGLLIGAVGLLYFFFFL